MSQKNNSYYVLKVLSSGGAVFPATEIYGEVEIRPASSDREGEKSAISISSEKASLKSEHEISSRIATCIQASSWEDSILGADEKFVPVLDLLSAKFPLSDFSLTQAGYVKNLNSGEITPIQTKSFGPNMTFIVPRGAIKKWEFEQWVLRQTSDLANRYKRSIHWTRSAKWEKSAQMAILYRWFSIEALFKENDGDDITSLILLHLGFPGSTYSRNISRNLLAEFAKNADWAKWKKLLHEIVDKIRIFRNDSVHSGFRNVDYSLGELRLYNEIMTYAASRSQGAVKAALTQKISSVTEFKEYAGVLFESNGNVFNDVINNIVFTLNNNVRIPTSNGHL